MYEVRKIRAKNTYLNEVIEIPSDKEGFGYNTSASLLQTIMYQEYLEQKVDLPRGEENTYIIIKTTRYSLIASGFEPLPFGISSFISAAAAKNSLIYKLLIDYEEFWDD